MKFHTEYLTSTPSSIANMCTSLRRWKRLSARAGCVTACPGFPHAYQCPESYVNDNEEGLIQDIDTCWKAGALPGRLPAPPDRRRQRRFPPQSHPGPPPGHSAGHQRQTAAGHVAKSVLCGIRRPAPKRVVWAVMGE